MAPSLTTVALVLTATTVTAFAPQPAPTAAQPAVARTAVAREPEAESSAVASLDRRALLSQAAAMSALVAASPAPVVARGRGTQAAMAQRYYPRITDFGEFLAKDLPSIVNNGDWAKLEEACKAEVDQKKGKIGKLYNGESAMLLWASSYSEVAMTPKTKEMNEKVEALADARAKLTDVAGKGTGNGLKMVGGVFGIGAKQEEAPPTAVLKSQATQAAAEAKKAYNEYVALNNVGIPLEINTLNAI